jgi:nucleoside-diphosphate-sugar epimerase
VAGKGSDLPQEIESEDALDELLTRPRPALVEAMKGVAGPLVMLGAGGKMGPHVAVMARRAAEAAGRPLEVIAVSRFGDGSARAWLEARGVRTVSADLLEAGAERRLPEASHAVFLVGQKFGTAADPGRTWAVNTLAPSRALQRYAGRPFVALSTGNVYPLVPPESGGAREEDPLSLTGEYAASAVARERVVEFHSRRDGTRAAVIRLNYSVELRYGVLVDIGRRVLAGEPVDVRTGWLNCIWQGDACDAILRALAHVASPPRVLNLTGPETLSVRALGERLGALLGRAARFEGEEAETALLSNPGRAVELFGAPPTPVEKVLAWTARWLERGGRLLDRPTHFEVRDGKY